MRNSSLTVSIIFCWLVTYSIVSGAITRAEHLNYCKSGQEASFYQEDFRTKDIYGETYDNFCFTHDLISMQCCLDTSLDIDSSASIIDFKIYNLTSPGGSPLQWSLMERESGKVTGEKRCVTYLVDHTHTCKVKIVYRESDAANSTSNKTAVYFSTASYNHPKVPYSIEYRAPLVDIWESENWVTASVTPTDVHDGFFGDWLLCVCLVRPDQSAIPQCELNDSFIWKKPKFDLESTSQLCFAVAKEYGGTFGPNRTCLYRPLHNENVIWQKLIVVSLAVVAFTGFVAAVAYSWKKYSSGQNSGNSSPLNLKRFQSSMGRIGSGTTDEEIEHYYSYINYDEMMVQPNKSEYRPNSWDSAIGSERLYSSGHESDPANTAGAEIDYPNLSNTTCDDQNARVYNAQHSNLAVSEESTEENVFPPHGITPVCNSLNSREPRANENSQNACGEKPTGSKQPDEINHSKSSFPPVQNWYELTQGTK